MYILQFMEMIPLYSRNNIEFTELGLFPSLEQRDAVGKWLCLGTQDCTLFKNRIHLGYARRLGRAP
jgi:hypothetical protein